jgi:drug/metabolite transporter (DMT)-like permease
MHTRRRNVKRAHLGLLYVAALWGVNVFAVKSISDTIAPMPMMAYRFLVAAAILGIYLVIKGKDLRQSFLQGALLGLLVWGFFGFTTYGIMQTSAVNAAFIMELNILFVPLFLLIFFHQVPGIKTSFALLLAMVGMLLLLGGFNGLTWGDGLMVVGCIFEALYFVVADRFVHKAADPLLLSFQQFIIVSFLSFMAMALWGISGPTNLGTSLLPILYLALLPTLSAFTLLLYGQRYAGAVNTSVIVSTAPLFTVLASAGLGLEPLTPVRLFGGALIMLAVLVAEWPRKHHRRRHVRH